MRHHRELFSRLQNQTGMYLLGESYLEAVAFVLGYDMANEGGSLAGFREWLVLRTGRGANLAWSSLVLFEAFPNVASPQLELARGSAQQRVAVVRLFDLIGEFDREREQRDGLAMIYREYSRWEDAQRP